MTGFRGLSLALVMAGLLAPLSAEAQRETRETREAAKQLGIAAAITAGVGRSENPEADKEQAYRAALAALQPALTSDVENALVWKLAGEAHAGLGHMVEAKEAFDKALSLHPDYEQEIADLREVAWITGFQQGVGLLEAGQQDEALALLTAANALYDERPEAYLNIASIHAQRGEIQPAIDALEKAIEKTQGPLYEQLDSAGQAQWRDFRVMAETNVSQMLGAAGVQAFQGSDYVAAQQWFERARQKNPYARDFLFNIVQAKWAQALDLEKQIEASPDQASQVAPRLTQLYQEIKTQIPQIRQVDPNNNQIVMMAAQTEKRLREMEGDSANANPAAYAILQELETMPVAIDDVAVLAEGNTAEISGTVTNLNIEGGGSVTVKITLIGSDGSHVGSADIQVQVPAKPEEGQPQPTPFQATAQVTAPVAGWRYTVAVG